MSDITQQLGITKDDVVSVIAAKLADQYADPKDIHTMVESLISDRVKKAFGEGVINRIDELLNAEMKRILEQTITPVNVWGEATGKPTTLRDQLAEKSRVFWEEKIGKDGRCNTYGGTPRYQVLMKEMLNESFTAAVKANAEVIVKEFKAALLKDSQQMVADHINRLINVKSR